MTSIRSFQNPVFQQPVQFAGQKHSKKQPSALLVQPKPTRSWMKTGLATASLVLMSIVGCAPTESKPENPAPPAQQTPVNPPATNQPTDTPMAQAPKAKEPFTLEGIDARLKSPQGLEGLIHGSDSERNMFVLTVTDNGNILRSMHFPLIAQSDEAQKALAALTRHDTVRVKGHLEKMPGTPQRHIAVDSLQLDKHWTPAFDVSNAKPFHYSTELPKDLQNKTEFTALVHANLEGGSILLMDYKDRVVQVIVPEAGKALTKDLWRGDTVTLHYKIKRHPEQPTHLVLDTKPADNAEPVHTVHQLKTWDDDKLHTFKGNLVVFPQSPVLNQNTWAIEQTDERGLTQYFTMANFEDTADHIKLVKKLEGFWNTNKQNVVEGRNKYINTGVQVEVTAKVLVMMANQANPTLPITSNDIKLVEKKAP